MLPIIIYFLLAFCLGFVLIQFLKIDLFLEEKLAWGLSLGVLWMTLLLFVFSLFFGFTKMDIFLFLGLTSVLLSALVFKNKNKFLEILNKDVGLFLERFRSGRLTLFLVLLAISILFFGSLWSRTFFYDQSGNIMAAGISGVWGDWGLHSAYTSHFAYSDKIILQEPIFANHRLSYTFFADFLSAIFVKMGSDFVRALVLPGLIFSLLLITVLYYFAFRLSARQNVAFLAIFLFILAGGLGFLTFFQDTKGMSISGIIDFLGNSDKQYTNLPANGIYWTSFINTLLLPQRALTFGLVFGLIILTCLSIAIQKNEGRLFLLAGTITGLMPTVHLHTLMASAIVGYLMIFLLSDFPKKIPFKNFLYFAAPALLFGLPQLIFLIPSDAHFIRFQKGWIANDNLLSFWIKNLGLFFLLIPLMFWRTKKQLKLIYLSFFSLFLIGNTVIFQPYDYDNLKIFTFWSVLNATIFAVFLIDLWNKKILFKILSILLGIILIASASIDVFHLYIHSSYQLFSKSDIELAEIIRQKTNPDDIFLTSDQHNNPIVDLTGRSVLMGYRGWLWSHGFDYKERESDILQMFQGGPRAKDLIGKYDIAYVMLGPAEKTAFSANEGFFIKNYPLFIDFGEIKIYKISTN